MKFLATFIFREERLIHQTQLVAASLDDAKICVEWMEKTFFSGTNVEVNLFEMEVVKCAKLADLLHVLLKKEEE